MPSQWKRQENLEQMNKEKGMKVISGEMLEDRSQSSLIYNDKQKNTKKNSTMKRKICDIVS